MASLKEMLLSFLYLPFRSFGKEEMKEFLEILSPLMGISRVIGLGLFAFCVRVIPFGMRLVFLDRMIFCLLAPWLLLGTLYWGTFFFSFFFLSEKGILAMLLFFYSFLLFLQVSKKIIFPFIFLFFVPQPKHVMSWLIWLSNFK